MKFRSRPVRVTSLTILFVVLAISALLVPILSATYAYDSMSMLESAAGLVILVAACAVVWWYPRRAGRSGELLAIKPAVTLGLALGLLWVVEIGYNNFVAPPLPGRDIVDNIFWAVISLAIFVLAITWSYRTKRIGIGILVGVWSGFASGALACCMALAMVVFGMRFLIHDPLNVSEWAALGGSSRAPTMAAYFAFETLFGALGHLGLIGIFLGGLLGLVGGCVGRVARMAKRWIQHA